MIGRTHAVSMGVEAAERQANGAHTLEPRFRQILDEEAARESRIVDEALAGPNIAIGITRPDATTGQIIKFASGLVALGYAVHSDWVRDARGNIVGIRIDGIKTRAGA